MSIFPALPLLPQAAKLPTLKGDTSWIDNPTGLDGLPTVIAPVRPIQTTSGTYDAATGQKIATPSTPANPVDSNKSILDNIKENWKDILGASVGQVTGNNPASVTWGIEHPLGATTNLLSSRWVILLIGLMLIGAGLMQFKATQVVIETGTKVAKAVTA